VILQEPPVPDPAPDSVAVADPLLDVAAAAGPVGAGDADALALAQQCAWTLVWLAVLASALNYWGSWSAGPWAAVASPVLVAVALAGVVLVWTVPRPVVRGLQAAGLGVALVTAGLAQGTAIHLRQWYATDSAAFNQVATRILLDGHNPYPASMAPAARLLHPAAAYWTYQADGGHALRVSYPAGAFLIQAPFMALGLVHLATDWVDLGAWLVTAVLLFSMLPSFLRWLAPLLLMSGVFLGPFANGGTDALFVPFLVLAVWRWDRFPGRAVPWLPAWVGPVALGVACSIKQTPWFCVPFLVVGVACGARRAGTGWVGPAARYLVVVVATFLLIDLPFLVASPSAWLHGAFLPLVTPLVADGQGLVALALHGLTGGVVTAWMTAAAGVALVGMVAAFALWQARLKRVWLFLVPLVLFLPDRSLANYLTDFVPAALVAALSVTVAGLGEAAGATCDEVAGDPGAPARRRGRPAWLAPVTVGVPTVVSAVLLVVAFTSAPLAITVDGVAASGVATVDGPLTWDHVVVTVHNSSGTVLTPHFMVSSGGGHPSGFWTARAVRGTAPVAPGATTRFVLRPTGDVAAPPRGQWWIVEAYSSPPDALSTSPLQRWSPGRPGG
jgi:uncharacterized membrane protein